MGNIGCAMSEPANINAQIIEGLYSEALVLSDEVRSAFTPSDRLWHAAEDGDLARVALSSEGLRTTTRMMHATAWLLNQRAYFMGELSELQLRRYGKLSDDLQGSDPANLAFLDPEICSLIAATERFYARLRRIDQGWRETNIAKPGAILRLRERLSRLTGREEDSPIR